MSIQSEVDQAGLSLPSPCPLSDRLDNAQTRTDTTPRIPKRHSPGQLASQARQAAAVCSNLKVLFQARTCG